MASPQFGAGDRGRAHSGLTNGQKTQLRYWTEFRRYANEQGATLRVGKPQPDCVISMAIGRTDFQLSAAHARGASHRTKLSDHIRVELAVSGANRRSFCDQLEARKGEIASGLGTTPTWVRPAPGRTFRIYVSQDAPIRDPDDWPNQHRWLLDWLQKFDDVFRPLVQSLDA